MSSPENKKDTANHTDVQQEQFVTGANPLEDEELSAATGGAPYDGLSHEEFMSTVNEQRDPFNASDNTYPETTPAPAPYANGQNDRLLGYRKRPHVETLAHEPQRTPRG